MAADNLARLKALPTTVLSDALRRLGFDPGTMHSAMKPVWEGAELCGPAFTVRTYPGATHGCDLALAQACRGDVLVLAGGGFTEVILWGEIFSTCAKLLGAGGTLIDGAARDVTGIREIRYPVFARAVTPRGGTFDKDQSATQVPVSCAGVVVHPGDYIRGDETGVVVVPVRHAAEVLAWAEAAGRRETRMLELARSGATMADIRRIIVAEGL